MSWSNPKDYIHIDPSRQLITAIGGEWSPTYKNRYKHSSMNVHSSICLGLVISYNELSGNRLSRTLFRLFARFNQAVCRQLRPLSRGLGTSVFLISLVQNRDSHMAQCSGCDAKQSLPRRVGQARAVRDAAATKSCSHGEGH